MSWNKAIKYVISLALLIAIGTQLDIRTLLEKLHHINPTAAGTALFLIILQIIILNLRWHLFLKPFNNSITFETSSIINIAGYFANIIFITAIGGIVTKSGLAIRQGLSLTQSIFVTLMDRMMTVIALLIFCVVGIPFLTSVLSAELAKILMLFCFCAAITVVVIVASFKTDWPGPLKKLKNQKQEIITILKTFLQDKKQISVLVMLSLIAQACFIMSIFVLSWNASILNHDNILEFFALLPILILVASLPISFGGWGVREGAFIYGLGLIGFSIESAFLLSVQIGLITLIAPFIVGIAYLLKSDLKLLLDATNHSTISQ